MPLCHAMTSTAMTSTAMASTAMASTAMASASVAAHVSLGLSAEASSMMQLMRKRATKKS